MTLLIYNAVTALGYDLEGSNPIMALREGHVSHVTSNGLIEERDPLIAQGTNGQNIAEETNKIIDLKTVARFYHNQTDRAAGVWLREAATGDIYARQALIYDITITWLSQRGRTRLLTHGNVFYGELVITRHPEWESAISQGFSQTISLRGGTKILDDYYYKGMTGARIASLIVRDPRIAGTNRNINEVWIGIREKGLGFSSFVPKQQCEIGANGPDTSNVNQTYFNGGTAKQVTFNTTPQMTNRVTFTLSNFTLSNYHHFFGEYLILLAYQHSQTPAAGQIIAQLTGENVITSPPTQLPSTGAVLQSQFIELGVFHSLKIGDKPSPEPVEGRGGYGFDKLSLRLVLKQMKHTLLNWGTSACRRNRCAAITSSPPSAIWASPSRPNERAGHSPSSSTTSS